MKRPLKSSKHIDHEAAAATRRAMDKVRALIDCGDEEGYVALMKELNPALTPGELVEKIQQFREIRRIRAGGA